MGSLNPLDWMKHKIDVWETMRLDLDLGEEGLLARFYDIMHRAGEPIPADPAWLSRACRVSSRIITKMAPKLLSAGFITAEVGGKFLWSAYVEEELENSAERSNKARKGADARWRRGRNAAENDAKSADNPDEFHESREDNSSQNRDKYNKGNESVLQTQCYKDESREDEEGGIPFRDTPSSEYSPSYNDYVDEDDTDARQGASGHSQPLLSKGDQINAGLFGTCIVDDFGLIGRSRWVKARRSDNNDRVFVPVNNSDRLMINDAMYEPEFRTSYRADEVRWVDPIDCPIPRMEGRSSDAA